MRSLPDRPCYPDDFSHSHRVTQSEEMLIIATRCNGIENCIRSLAMKSNLIEITVRKLLCSVVIRTFLFDMYFKAAHNGFQYFPRRRF